jgi:Uncharacterized protein conserved in bacteria (DUF2188)
MADIRFVKQNEQGSWDVLREGDRRATVHDPTQREATRRARAILRKAGGGDVVGLDREGKVTEADRVVRPRRSARTARRRARSLDLPGRPAPAPDWRLGRGLCQTLAIWQVRLTVVL